MNKYGCAVTKKGLALIAGVIASKAPLTITGVMMDSGEPEDGIYIGDLETLVEPVAAGTVSDPVQEGSTVSMTVEYRSDMNGGLQEGFIIREFGVFARDGDGGEILLYYGCLADYPQYIAPWDGMNLDVRRYPISITVAEGTEVKLDKLPGTVMTIDDVKDYCVSTLLPQLLTASRNQIVDHNKSETAHPQIREELETAKNQLQEEISAAKAAAKEATDAAEQAKTAAEEAKNEAEHSAGGCAVELTFAEGTAGQTYEVVGGNGEVYTGTIPEDLKVTVTVKQCDTEYTVTTQDDAGNISTNKVTTGPYFGPSKVTVTDFSAVLTVKAAAGAQVTAVCGAQSYRAQAGENGEAELSIGTAGRYTVTASLDGKTVSGFVDVTESKSYRLELGEFREDLNAAPVARSHIVFEPEEWEVDESGACLRIPASEHGLEPKQESCVCTLRERLGRTAYEYDGDGAATARAVLVAAVSKALEVNASTPDTYPTAEDGHVILTWEQVQYALLESTSFEEAVEPAEGEESGTRTVWNIALAGAEDAAAKAEELGFGKWKNRDNGVEPTVTLDELLSAAYLPALGGVSTNFDSLCTLEALQGLRFRRGVDGDGYAAKYDLDGRFMTTWGAMSSQVYWDLAAQDLVVDGPAPFAGDILVMG